MSRRDRMAERVTIRDVTGPATLACGCRVPAGQTVEAAQIGHGRRQCLGHARQFRTVAEVLAAEQRRRP
jgi:hypothetical protein